MKDYDGPIQVCPECGERSDGPWGCKHCGDWPIWGPDNPPPDYEVESDHEGFLVLRPTISDTGDAPWGDRIALCRERELAEDIARQLNIKVRREWEEGQNHGETE